REFVLDPTHRWRHEGHQLAAGFHRVRDNEMPAWTSFLLDIQSLDVATVRALRLGFLPTRQKEQNTRPITVRNGDEPPLSREDFRIRNAHAFVPLWIGKSARASACQLAQMLPRLATSIGLVLRSRTPRFYNFSVRMRLLRAVETNQPRS